MVMRTIWIIILQYECEDDISNSNGKISHCTYNYSDRNYIRNRDYDNHVNNNNDNNNYDNYNASCRRSTYNILNDDHYNNHNDTINRIIHMIIVTTIIQIIAYLLQISTIRLMVKLLIVATTGKRYDDKTMTITSLNDDKIMQL